MFNSFVFNEIPRGTAIYSHLLEKHDSEGSKCARSEISFRSFEKTTHILFFIDNRGGNIRNIAMARSGSAFSVFNTRSFQIYVSKSREIAEHAYMFLNALLFAVALVLIVFGTYVVVERGQGSASSTAIPQWAILLVFVVAIVLVACGTLGCLLVYKDKYGSNWFASLYVSLMTAVSFSLLYCVISLSSARAALEQDTRFEPGDVHVESSLMETLSSTWKTSFLSDPKDWMETQTSMECCGFDAASAYRAYLGYGIDYQTGPGCTTNTSAGGLLPFPLDQVWTEVLLRAGPGNPSHDSDIEGVIKTLKPNVWTLLIGPRSFYCKEEMKSTLMENTSPIIVTFVCLFIITIAQIVIFCALVCCPLPVEYGDMDSKDAGNSGRSISRALRSHRYLDTGGGDNSDEYAEEGFEMTVT